ncbi:MAG: hypothetical protein ACREIT_11510 [Tepidisphaeraceae bacterium]
MTDLIFDLPWWLPAIIAAVGAGLWVSGNKRVDRTLKNVGLVILTLAILFTVVSYLVDTDRETAIDRTRRLVNAVQKRDWTTFSTLLDPKTSFLAYRDRAALVNAAQVGADNIGLKGVTITGLEATQDQTLITVDLTVLTDQEVSMGRPIVTNWRFDWTETAEGWFLTHIDYLPNEQVKLGQVTSRLPAP